MLFKTYSHRNAQTIFKKIEKYSSLYREVLTAIDSILDEDLIQNFKNSLSESFFELLKEHFHRSCIQPCFRHILEFAKARLGV